MLAFIWASRFNIYKLPWFFNHNKHKNYIVDRFVTVSHKFLNKYETSLFFYEISHTYTRHMMYWSPTNLFLITIMDKYKILDINSAYQHTH